MNRSITPIDSRDRWRFELVGAGHKPSAISYSAPARSIVATFRSQSASTCVARFGWRHAEWLVSRDVTRVHNSLLFKVSRHDTPCPGFQLLSRSVRWSNSQSRLAFGAVEPVTGKTVIGQDRQHVTIVSHGIFGNDERSSLCPRSPMQTLRAMPAN